MNSKRFPKPQPRMPKPKRSVSDWLQSHKTELLKAGSLFLLFAGIVCLLAVSPGLQLKGFVDDLRVGQISPREVKAGLKFNVYDKEETEIQKEAARRNAPPVYFVDKEVANEILIGLEEKLFGTVRAVLSEGKTSWEDAGDILEPYNIDLPIFALLSQTKEVPTPEEEEIEPSGEEQVPRTEYVNLDDMQQKTISLLQDVLYEGVIKSDTKNAIPQEKILVRKSQDEEPVLTEKEELLDEMKAPERLQSFADTKYFPDPEDSVKRAAIIKLAGGFLDIPTLLQDEEASLQKADQAAAQVGRVYREILQHASIIQEGDTITQEHIEDLREYLNQMDEQRGPTVLLGVGLLTAFLGVMMWRYMATLYQDIWAEPKLICLVAVLVLMGGITAKLFQINNWPEYMVPLSFVAILATILINRQIATMVALLTSLIALTIFDYDAHIFMVALAGSVAGVLGAARMRRRSEIVLAGLLVAAANAAVILGLGLATNLSGDWVGQILYGMLNGLISAGLVMFLVWPLERIFDATTDLRLIELSDTNHPLLQRMMNEAPGTFQHTLQVASLADSAARATDANSLLVRVAAYYHDVGKVVRPNYFSENQDGKNPHDDLSPTMSCKIIVDHVKEGVRLAREHKLPKPIVDMIPQHHGTCQVSFLLQKASEMDKYDSISEDDFRYPGPRPQTREAAILMLSDACEAVSRTLENPTHGRVRSTVEKIINERFVDSQFDECDLTLKDLHKIADSLTRSIMNATHKRIVYPVSSSQAENREKSPEKQQEAH